MTIVVIVCSALAFVLGAALATIYALARIADTMCEADDYMDGEIEELQNDDDIR